MEASSKVVSFLFISILSGQSSCALFSRPRSRYALEVVFAASVSHSLKLSWLYYGIADEQKLQGPDPRPVWSRCGTAGSPGSAALPLHASRRGAPALAFALKTQDPGTLPLNTLCRTPVQVSRVWICVTEGKNGPGVAAGGSVCVFCLAVGGPLSGVTNLLRHRYDSSRQSANVETH